jgi:uncharacterized membrane protein YdbT with pleckstrin-like domain
VARKVNTEKDLGEALKSGEDFIEIEGDLARKTIRIRATGKAAWMLAIGSLGIAAFAAYATVGTGGAAAPIASAAVAVAAPAAVGVLGISATVSALGIAIAAGGIGALTTLRKYKEVSRTGNTLVLQRR